MIIEKRERSRIRTVELFRGSSGGNATGRVDVALTIDGRISMLIRRFRRHDPQRLLRLADQRVDLPQETVLIRKVCVEEKRVGAVRQRLPVRRACPAPQVSRGNQRK